MYNIQQAKKTVVRITLLNEFSPGLIKQEEFYHFEKAAKEKRTALF